MSDDSPETFMQSPVAEQSGWPWSRVARPAVIAGERGGTDTTAVAAIDFAILAARDALVSILARPIQLRGVDAGDADVAPQGFGVAFSSEAGLDALVMLDARALRLLANAVASDQGGSPSSAAPGPVAELSDAEKGLMEYLTLATLDVILKSSHHQTHGPIIRAFCDGAAAGLWLQKSAARTIAIELAMTGATGTIRIHLAGLSEVNAAALVGCMSMLEMPAAGLAAVNVSLALPAIALQPQEFASLQVGDVLLLGGPSLTAMPVAGELVTETNWSLGRAVVTHDTPTYLSIAVRPGKPGPRPAALHLAADAVVQPILGLANATIDSLRALREGDTLHLTKDPVVPVGLYHGCRRIAGGELVVLGSELGMRVVEKARSSE